MKTPRLCSKSPGVLRIKKKDVVRIQEFIAFPQKRPEEEERQLAKTVAINFKRRR